MHVGRWGVYEREIKFCVVPCTPKLLPRGPQTVRRAFPEGPRETQVSSLSLDPAPILVFTEEVPL